ncbi:MAG: molybdopterin oxidoreductase, partial [Desulfobacteraceae bacterium]
MKHNKAQKFGMVIDLDKCTGCGSCMVACMSENNVPFRKDESNKLLSITWMRVYRLTNGKSFPNTDICYL